MSISDEAIYKEHSVELVRYACALVGSADGPDLLSIVVTKVLARGRLSDLDSPKRYLLRAISNEAKSHHRQRSRRQLVGFPAGGTAPPPESDVVFEAVMDLPVRQRSATVTRHVAQTNRFPCRSSQRSRPTETAPGHKTPTRRAFARATPSTNARVRDLHASPPNR